MAEAASHSLPDNAGHPRSVLYAGSQSALIAAALAPVADRVTFHAESRVSAALVAAARLKAECVIVDLSDRDDALILLITALAAARHPPAIIVLARPDDVSRCLRYPGVRSVLTVPFKPMQLRRAVAGRPEFKPAPVPPPAETPVEVKPPAAAVRQAAWPDWRLRLLSPGRFMALVSSLYKNAAFVLLATLFAAFMFYGFLIAYFLLSSSWGAPVTLTRGHQMVEKAVNDVGELKTNLSLTSQRLSEAQLEARKAGHARDDAAVLVDFIKGTVDSEIASRLKQIKTSEKTAARIEKVMAQFTKEEDAGQNQPNPRELYKKRLITKRSYDSLIMGSLEATQRYSALETERDALHDQVDTQRASIDLLESLRQQLDLGRMNKVTSANADLILLTKEAVDARSALDQAISQVASAEERQKLLQDSARLMRERIAEIEQGPLGRAAFARIDVIFVPYGNEKHFKPGTALYTCALTILFCHRAGTVGATLPGESTAVHPFFGKPLRGFFVDAKLADPDAASEEIIHAGRPPFFF